MSKQSLEKSIRLLNEFKNNYQKGIHNSIKVATEAMYNKVLEHCYENGIYLHTDAIHWDYDDNTNTGKVWTYDWVLIFNEMGTGIVGSENPHPSSDGIFKNWKYDVNEHGEKGWKYPKKDGTYGWTSGLPSRHMFYSAFEDIKNELGNYIQVELRKTNSNMY